MSDSENSDNGRDHEEEHTETSKLGKSSKKLATSSKESQSNGVKSSSGKKKASVPLDIENLAQAGPLYAQMVKLQDAKDLLEPGDEQHIHYKIEILRLDHQLKAILGNQYSTFKRDMIKDGIGKAKPAVQKPKKSEISSNPLIRGVLATSAKKKPAISKLH